MESQVLAREQHSDGIRVTIEERTIVRYCVVVMDERSETGSTLVEGNFVTYDDAREAATELTRKMRRKREEQDE